MSESVASADRQIARAAGVVMSGFVLSSLTGLVSQILITREFGTSAELDAFVAGNRVPETIFNLIAGGALASAFLPTLTGFLTRDDHAGGWRLTSAVANLVIVILGLVSLLASAAAPWLVRTILVPGFEDPQQIQLTVSLLRTMLLSPTIFGVSGLLMATLNAHQHFALPALAPASYRIGLILGVVVLVPRIGIHGLAWGTVLGAVLHLSVQIPALVRRKPHYYPSLGLRMPAVREVGRLMAPRLLGVAVVQLNFWVNTMIASGQPEGSLTALNFAFLLMIMPQAAIAQATAIAALPTFSTQYAQGKLDQMRASLVNTLRGVIFLALPASLGLILLRRPIVGLLFERGAFDAQSTDQVAWALLWWAAGLVGHSVFEIVVRAFFAMHDTRTPVAVGALMMSLNVVFSIAFSAFFERIGWMPHGGLALANSLATALECVVLLWLLSKRLEGLDLTRIRPGLISTAGGTATMSLALLGWSTVMSGWSNLVIGA
ncbi:MAG: murein biosynthesis integral membrane protein MurJ, partial [Anaerolineales bacterium]|nr:murein biosynthesis integral membrane protein MurJ [Anaerolineales bacterium]